MPVQAQFGATAGRLVGKDSVNVLEAVGMDGSVVGGDLLIGEEAAGGMQRQKCLAVFADGEVGNALRVIWAGASWMSLRVQS